MSYDNYLQRIILDAATCVEVSLYHLIGTGPNGFSSVQSGCVLQISSLVPRNHELKIDLKILSSLASQVLE